MLLALIGLGLLAALLMVPGVFTVDENHTVAWLASLRAGRVTLPGTDGLPRSGELHFFDPVPLGRAAFSVASVVPPLHGPLALVFSYLGWTGLILLNLVAWMATTGLVYVMARRSGAGPTAAAVGALAFALSGFSLEYAIGVWPHALAAGLCLGCFVLALEAARDRPNWALGAGLLGGLAIGVRYQNVVFAALVGVVLLVVSSPRRRVRSVASYAAGLVPPLVACSVFNHLRLGSWNPISKGSGYVKLNALAGDTSAQPLRAIGAQVVDFSWQAHLPYWEEMGGRWSQTGALLLSTAVKKALLQSAPWMLLVLVALVFAWRKREPAGPDRRITRAVAWISAGVLLLFALAGIRRYDGWCSNSRYLLELMPLGALVLALVVERQHLSWRRLATGAGAGALLTLYPLTLSPASPIRQHALLHVPLLLAAACAVMFVVAMRWSNARAALALTLGAALGWGAAVHVGDDLMSARALREKNLAKLRSVSTLMPDGPVAIFAHGAAALGPLLLERDVVIADTAVDDGHDASAIADALLQAHRQVFAVLPNMPDGERRALLDGRAVTPVGTSDSLLVELGPRGP